MTGRGFVLRMISSAVGNMSRSSAPPQLLACDAERRTRHAPGHEINTVKGTGIKFSNVFVNHIPSRTVQSEGLAELALVFDNTYMVKASHLQADGLSATAGTQL